MITQFARRMPLQMSPKVPELDHEKLRIPEVTRVRIRYLSGVGTLGAAIQMLRVPFFPCLTRLEVLTTN